MTTPQSKIRDFCQLPPVPCGYDKGSLRALPRQYNYLTNWNLEVELKNAFVGCTLSYPHIITFGQFHDTEKISLKIF